MKKITLSLVFVIAIAALTQYVVTQKFSESGRDRNIANLSERNNNVQIKWEQQIADELSSQSIQAAQRPNIQDQLLYEFFMGQYNLNVEAGVVKAIVLQANMQGVSFDANQFVKLYGSAFKDYKTYSVDNAKNGDQEVKLYGQSGDVVGKFYIKHNSDGRVQEVTIE